MPKLRGKSVDIATNRILRKIENFDLASGEVVSDLELSKELNMSRTPVREAIMSLLDAGILERTQTKVIVKPLTLTDIIEILQVRESIELKSAEIILANGGLNVEQRSELEAIHDQLWQNITQGNFSANFEADEVFHHKIIEFSHNSRLLDIYKRLSLQSQRLRWFTLLTPDRYVKTLEEHKEILQNLYSMNQVGVAKAIRTHIANTQKNYQAILNNKWDKIASEIKRMNA
ncbi:MAG: FCD domain protein [Clostridium sp.]|jgi:GntR family transcriptional regulator, rspAB operon transcriptional repressor